MTPDFKTLLRGSTTWREEHRGVSLSQNHHGYRDGVTKIGDYLLEYAPGTWCYYLLLVEQMFRPSDWSQLWLPNRETDWGMTCDYHDFPGLDFHGGCTFYEKGEQWDKKAKRLCGTIKVGCDYNHLWDHEANYPDNYQTVLIDARQSVDTLISVFPDRLERCGYSGQWGETDEFYTARNGARVHISQKTEFSDEKWPSWQPVLGAAA